MEICCRGAQLDAGAGNHGTTGILKHTGDAAGGDGLRRGSRPLGRAIVVIVGAIADLERNLIIERVRAGMRRAKLEGRQIGRRPLDLDRTAILRDRARGLSLTQVAKAHGISRAMVSKIVKEAKNDDSHEGGSKAPFQVTENEAPQFMI